jgi:putative hydrolase of the HAD superfamily
VASRLRGSKVNTRPSTHGAVRAGVFDLGDTLVRFTAEGETWWDVERRAFARAHRFLSEHHADAAWEPFFERIKRFSDDYWKRATAGELSFVVDHIVRDTFVELGVPLSEEVERGTVDAFCAEVADACTPFDDAAPVLEALKGRGLKLGLISNTMIHGRIHADDLRRFGLLGYFDDTVFSGDVGLWKPDRRIFERSVAALGVRPEEAFFVGDRIVDDVGGAQAAGLRAVLKVNPRTDSDYLDPRAATIEPDARIDTLGELPPIVDRWLARPPKRR